MISSKKVNITATVKRLLKIRILQVAKLQCAGFFIIALQR